MSHALYILVRSDLDSMTPEKGMAQASHAANAFGFRVHKYSYLYTKPVEEWENMSPQGFGTVIILRGTQKQINTAILIMDSLGYITDIIHDDTYPINDGDICHSIPLDTCGYVFVPNKKTDDIARAVFGRFTLSV